MKLKTFFATYLLFLIVLFACFTFLSSFMINTQMEMHMEQSAAEYQRVAVSLSRDIAVLLGVSQNFIEDLNNLLYNYMAHYAQANVTIGLTVLPEAAVPGAVVSYLSHGGESFIEVVGVLPEPFGFLRLDYLFNITEAVAQMTRIRNTLLTVCVAFAALTAPALYFILSRVFQALEIHNQMQTLKDEADAKQQFVDNIAHELRTPLTSIFGYAEYVQKIASDNEETIESMQYIMDEAAHMQNMSNSLLALATLRGYTAEKNKINIPELFGDIKHSLKTYQGFSKTQFVCKNDTDAMYGQEDLIKSLLINLCTNAIKACLPDGGTVSVEINEIDGGIILSVTDSGHGIQPEALPAVTEPFYRVDKARNRLMGGAGLGLALCKRIAAAHGAEIKIESTVDTGTRVEVIFYNSTTTPQ